MNWNAVINQLDKDCKRLVDEAAALIKVDGPSTLVRDKMLIHDILFNLAAALNNGYERT